MRSNAILPRVLRSLAALTVVLLVAAALTGNEALRVAGTVVLALFGLLIVVLIFGGLLSTGMERDDR